MTRVPARTPAPAPARALRPASGAPRRRSRGTLLLTLALALAAACGDRDGEAPAASSDGGQGGGGGQGGSGGSPGQSDAPCHDYTTFDRGVAVDFRAEVLPLFQRSCATGASCHARKDGSPLQPYLGPTADTPAAQVGEAELAAIREQNVGVDATEAPAMKRVAPGDPERSFLMHKIDGTLGCEILECVDACGLPMPPTLKPLSAAERDTVRRWIAHGAVIE
ncbi:hypothetical protein [Sorangium sp. So ce1024]|uniref:hypothetical protein n=1 Tax=Sorangium sp. So ce1024 TaxID=3133327 RepID=UPI003F0AF43A